MIDLYDKFIKKIRARTRFQNKNWLAIICGETGSGKSYSALSLAKQIGGKVFVLFTPLEFLKLLNSGKLSKGDCIIFDESGVGMSSREWYSMQNKLLGTVLQTFRNLNINVIFTTPNLSFIDVQARKLFHHYFETAHLDYDNCEAFLKCYEIQINSRLDKIYYKRPKIMDEHGRVYTMGHIVVDKPDEKITQYYEEKKTAYTKKLNEDALKELTEPKGKQKKEIDLQAVKKDVIKNKSKYLKEYKNRKFIDSDMIRRDYSLTIPQAKILKRETEEVLI